MGFANIAKWHCAGKINIFISCYQSSYNYDKIDIYEYCF